SSLQDVGFSGAVTGNGFNFSFGSGLIGASTPTVGLKGGGSIGSTRLDAALVALEEQGVIRTLARPNLVALSGEKANFHAGGEYPYPVPQRDNLITLEFRKYGVALIFTPTVTDNGLIRLEVEPSVTTVACSTSVRLQRA